MSEGGREKIFLCFHIKSQSSISAAVLVNFFKNFSWLKKRETNFCFHAAIYFDCKRARRGVNVDCWNKN